MNAPNLEVFPDEGYRLDRYISIKQNGVLGVSVRNVLQRLYRVLMRENAIHKEGCPVVIEDSIIWKVHPLKSFSDDVHDIHQAHIRRDAVEFLVTVSRIQRQQEKADKRRSQQLGFRSEVYSLQDHMP